MKTKLSLLVLAIFAVSMLGSISVQAGGMGACPMMKEKSAECATCICDSKAWYKPQSWFKTCPVCDNAPKDAVSDAQ
jgi:hypothetical protein